MDRRSVLRWSVAAALGSVAGCQARGTLSSTGGTNRDTPTPTVPSSEASTHSGRVEDLPVPESELTKSVRRDDIPAITDPAFGRDWRGIELEVQSSRGHKYVTKPRLDADDLVVGVVRDGEARAYPLKLLNFHEVVNDTLGGPLLVTYCPLCRSGLAARRVVDGRETIFGVDGRLWRANLVLYDQLTDSLWSQVAAQAIRGPMAGATFDILPSTITSWPDWLEEHPDTRVLLPPPASTTVAGDDVIPRDYSSSPYAEYGNSRLIPGEDGEFEDDRLHPKTLVVGVTAGESSRAYPLPAVLEAGVVNDVVGGRPVVVTATPGESLAAYDRRVDGRILQFEAAGDHHVRAAGSRWERSTGRAVDGPSAGTTLSPANELPPLFWFAWLDFHPESTVFGAASDASE